MGLFSSLAGAISSVGSAICSGISSVCSAVGGALFTGSGGIAALATAIIGPVVASPEVALIMVAIQAVASIVCAIAESVGLKDKNETPEELGMKAQKAEKKPEDFDSTQKYIEYLRNEVELDKKQIEKLSQEEKAGYAAVGTSLYIKGIEEQYGIKAPGEFWRTAADLELGSEDVKKYMETFKEHGIKDMADMNDYLKGFAPASGVQPRQVSDCIIEGLKKIYPEMGEEGLYEKLNEMSLKVSQ